MKNTNPINWTQFKSGRAAATIPLAVLKLTKKEEEYKEVIVKATQNSTPKNQIYREISDFGFSGYGIIMSQKKNKLTNKEEKLL